ncbi:hypothetical protein BP6252_10562 [Coleophoma cylindrospora]|uniref:DNA-directed RNA polymerase III subunit RPC9 n=1 Tax=Coleophoma cylindrospora TaxID=1849047 RepID=A0A3D8QTA2_9HELO|nr:hypothetical protein BP6252_10562 [Coleophoma cylindrospora]
MKILEAQSAILTNFEVYQHLKSQNEKHAALKKSTEKRLRKENDAKRKRTGKSGQMTSSETFDLRNAIKDVTRRPGNLETVVREIIEYLEEAPSPLASKPLPYDENTIRKLMERLRSYDLTKAELLMLMNIRPTNLEGLNVIIQELDLRFPEEETQYELVGAVVEILGTPDVEANKQAMTDAKEAKQAEEAQASTEMEVVEE